MIRLLIIAHAPLASALKSVAAHIDKDAADWVGACDVHDNQSQDDIVLDGAKWLDEKGPGETLILADAFGATPCNAARRLGERPDTRVVAGVNLPALWRAVGHMSEPLDRVAELAVSGGQQGLMHVSVSRPQFQAVKPNSNDPLQHLHQQ
jgi:PTS system ascorbate-specific IIA component